VTSDTVREQVTTMLAQIRVQGPVVILDTAPTVFPWLQAREYIRLQLTVLAGQAAVNGGHHPGLHRPEVIA